MGQRSQSVNAAAHGPQGFFLGTGASHRQHTAWQLLHGLGQLQRTFFGNQAAYKSDQMAVGRHPQPLPPVGAVLSPGQRSQLLGVYRIGQGTCRRNAKSFQPAAYVPGYAVKGKPAAPDDAAGQMFVPAAQHTAQPAVHHVAGGMVDDQRGNAPAPALAGSPDALGVHPGLDHCKVDALSPQIGGGSEGAQHREPSAHHGEGGQPVDLQPIVIPFPGGQPRQGAGHNEGPMARRHTAPGQILGIALHTARGGQVLRGKKAECHNDSFALILR